MTAFHERTKFLLREAGVCTHELEALDYPAIHTVPPMVPPGFGVYELGMPLTRDARMGWGLWGGTGNGKTWLMVQALAEVVERRVRACGRPSAALPPCDHWMMWVSWPEKADSLKRNVIGGGGAIKTWIQEAKWVRFLVLDDLGGERSRGEDDYARGVLSEVLDTRYRKGLPVWWTSNLDPEGMVDAYKSRLASRILGTWRPLNVQGEDLRLGAPLPSPVAAPPPVVDFRKAAGGDA